MARMIVGSIEAYRRAPNEHGWRPADGSPAARTRYDQLPDGLGPYANGDYTALLLIGSATEYMLGLSWHLRNPEALTIQHLPGVRAHLEAAAQAWWLLRPGATMDGESPAIDGDNERMARSILLHAESLRNERAYAKDLEGEQSEAYREMDGRFADLRGSAEQWGETSLSARPTEWELRRQRLPTKTDLIADSIRDWWQDPDLKSPYRALAGVSHSGPGQIWPRLGLGTAETGDDQLWRFEVNYIELEGIAWMCLDCHRRVFRLLHARNGWGQSEIDTQEEVIFQYVRNQLLR